MVFDVEDAGGVVGPLEVDADPREEIDVVAQHGAVGRAVEQEARLLYPAQEFVQRRPVHLGAVEAFQLQPAGVDRLPHVGGQRRAHGAGIAARGLEARLDARRVVGGKGEEIDHRVAARLAVMGFEAVQRAGGGERRFPLVRGAGIGDRHRREPARRVDDAGRVVGPLDIARKPEQRVGGAAQHGAGRAGCRVGKAKRAHAACVVRASPDAWARFALPTLQGVRAGRLHPSSTQVSFVPPP